jgi:hypothetical protein
MSNERYLIRRLLDGIAGWLTFQQAAGAKTLYCEHFLYPPIHDVAKGREWSVRAQEPIKKLIRTRGAPQTIDFIFFRNDTDEHYPGLVFLEIKYVRNANGTREINGLAEDMEKLSEIDSSDIESADTISECGTPRRFLLVVGQGETFQSLARVRSKKHPEIVKMLSAALQPKPANSVYRSYVESKLKKAFHWHVIAFGERAWPYPFERRRVRRARQGDGT